MIRNISGFVLFPIVFSVKKKVKHNIAVIIHKLIKFKF